MTGFILPHSLNFSYFDPKVSKLIRKLLDFQNPIKIKLLNYLILIINDCEVSLIFPWMSSTLIYFFKNYNLYKTYFDPSILFMDP